MVQTSFTVPLRNFRHQTHTVQRAINIIGYFLLRQPWRIAISRDSELIKCLLLKIFYVICWSNKRWQKTFEIVLEYVIAFPWNFTKPGQSRKQQLPNWFGWLNKWYHSLCFQVKNKTYSSLAKQRYQLCLSHLTRTKVKYRQTEEIPFQFKLL